MTQEDFSIQEKIILAVISCIEKEGIHNITTRKIAKEANVNIAAINYYFGKKENLINEAFNYIAKDFFSDTVKITDNQNRDLKSVIIELLTYFMEGCLRYPNLLRAILYDPYINNDYSGLFVKEVNNVINTIYENFKDRINEKQMSYLKESILQLVSAALFLGTFPGFFSDFAGKSFNDSTTLTEYIHRIAENFASVFNK